MICALIIRVLKPYREYRIAVVGLQRRRVNQINRIEVKLERIPLELARSMLGAQVLPKECER